MIWTTVWYQILIFRILKLLDLQNIAQLKRKRKLIMGAEFVTFDHAVNAMPLLCRVLYEGAAYMVVLKNFLCLFITCGLSAVRIIGQKLRYCIMWDIHPALSENLTANSFEHMYVNQSWFSELLIRFAHWFWEKLAEFCKFSTTCSTSDAWAVL